ncbi:tyrosine-type recombinase/integrase [Rhizobium sp. IBUN]|uniref:tyrosine-type recombinase/integrase n=1 Tax=Rhizobium sp. IBUN TaxID=1042326 RepID=UPI0004044DC5|nr:tyrosine-type recombinase/integrase [Rhizobium sp. IBUN]
MSVYKPKTSPYYQYDFEICGTRFHGTTKARNRREAEAIERPLKEKAKQDIDQTRKGGKPPLTIDIAVGRYWKEVACKLANEKAHFAALERLVQYFGKDTRLDDIDDVAIIRLVEFKQQQWRWGKSVLKNGNLKTVSNATINRDTLVPLKSIFIRARTMWKYQMPNEPCWKKHMLKEPKERIRELRSCEQEALEVHTRADYQPWFRFLQLSGRRFRETLLKWSDVNWDAKEIKTEGKGDRNVWTPITPAIREILEGCSGHHPVFVFTFVAQRTENGKIRGQRYPLTYGGAMSRWRRTVKEAGVEDFRLHDNRHDTATKVLRQTRNLKIVQRLLNHSNVATTSRYTHVLDDEIASAMEDYAKSREKSRTQTIETRLTDGFSM